MVQFISLEKTNLFGVRGDAHLDLTVYAKRPLHSGHYGNWAPNPAMMLAIISFNEDDGRVTIEGFYDDVIPLGPSEKLNDGCGMECSRMKGVSLNEAINLPSLNINGMQSGNVGKMASNQIQQLQMLYLT
jgi:acetylornithine deacetylase/succinyl-diaminopimelate desuccinylase-like protein